MKVIVSKEKCIGCGACVGISPNVYEFDDDGLAKVKVEEVIEEDKNSAIEALENCPTEAIIEVKEETQE